MTVDPEKAFKLVENDLSKSVFVKYPFEKQIIAEIKAAWLLKIKEDVTKGVAHKDTVIKQGKWYKYFFIEDPDGILVEITDEARV